MKQDGTIALFQYWNNLRNGRPAPLRTEIEPAQIKSLLADTFILERDMSGKAIYRLAGTNVCTTHGGELKGLSFTSLWTAKDQDLVGRIVREVFEAGAVTVVKFSGMSRNRRTNPFEMILLPLDGGVDTPRCIGTISPVHRPFWLGADPIVEAAVISYRIVDAGREAEALNSRKAIEVPALSPAHLDRTGLGKDDLDAPGVRRIRHLIVLDGGRRE